jgi:hypothetical protein
MHATLSHAHGCTWVNRTSRVYTDRRKWKVKYFSSNCQIHEEAWYFKCNWDKSFDEGTERNLRNHGAQTHQVIGILSSGYSGELDPGRQDRVFASAQFVQLIVLPKIKMERWIAHKVVSISIRNRLFRASVESVPQLEESFLSWCSSVGRQCFT